MPLGEVLRLAMVIEIPRSVSELEAPTVAAARRAMETRAEKYMQKTSGKG